MQNHPTTLVGTTPQTVEAAFRVLARGGKKRALRVARAAQAALLDAGFEPSPGIERLTKQIEDAEIDEQVIGPLEAIGTRIAERLKGKLAEAKKDGIDLARALEERVIAEERAEHEEGREARQAQKRLDDEDAAQDELDAKAEAERQAEKDARAAKRQAELDAPKPRPSPKPKDTGLPQGTPSTPADPRPILTPGPVTTKLPPPPAPGA